MKKYNFTPGVEFSTDEYQWIISSVKKRLEKNGYRCESTPSSLKVLISLYGPSWLKESIKREVLTDISSSFKEEMKKK